MFLPGWCESITSLTLIHLMGTCWLTSKPPFQKMTKHGKCFKSLVFWRNRLEVSRPQGNVAELGEAVSGCREPMMPRPVQYHLHS